MRIATLSCIRRVQFVMLMLLFMGSLTLHSSAHAAGRFFPETDHQLNDPFLSYWEAHGALPVFGYPVSEAFLELNADTGVRSITQYLERNRFEAHPENTAPYHVLLGRLGDEALRQSDRDWRTFPQAATTAAHRFEETGHAIAHPPFWRYWSTHGLEFDGKRGFSPAESLALFGLPLSEPQLETNASGDTVVTQWFERARFEDHGSKGVLLGLLGNEVTAQRRGEAPFQPVVEREQPSAAPQPTDSDMHMYARRLFEVTNQFRQEKGKLPFAYRGDLQQLGDHIAREFTEVKRSGGNVRDVLDRYNTQLTKLSPVAGIIYATVNIHLEAGCQGIDPHDPLGRVRVPNVAEADARTLTIGVFGLYDGPCGKAMSAVYIVGH
ncbi:MAG: hypothetical protein M3R24_14980 [Chloroflexota bacterium]|nr:hypothetical protein [Chloroflexota bacterium]